MLLVKNISKTYHSNSGNSTKALENVSLAFEQKGLIFITGKSGSGKSTLLNVLGGLEKIDSGEVIIKNKSSLDFTEEDFDSYRNTYLGFVFQDFGILENLSVGENVALSLKLQGYKNDSINTKVEEILDKVGLSNLGKRAPNELSGGQLQRVSIARALIKDPDIILADEPTANLDSETGVQIIKILQELSKDKLVLVVSHNNDYADEFADRIINLSDGKVVEDYYLQREIKNVKVKEKKSIKQKTKIKTYNNHISIQKTKLPFKYIFKSALSSLKKKRIKLLITLFLFTMSLFSLSISTLFSSYDISKSTINTMNYNDVESILIKKCNLEIDYTKRFDINECSFKSINKNEAVSIDRVVNSNNAVSYRLIDKGLPLPLITDSENEDLYIPQKIYGFIQVPKNNIFNIIEGHYPNEVNEVMITDYLVEPISKFKEVDKTNIIGSSFKYGDKNLTITGIISTNHEEYRFLNNVDYSSMNDDEIKKTKNKYKELLLNQEKLYSRFIVTNEFNYNSFESNKVDDIKLRAKDSTFLGFVNFNDYLTLDENIKTYPNELTDLSKSEIYIDLDLFLDRVLNNNTENTLTKETVLANLSKLDEFINQSFKLNLEYNNATYEDYYTIKGFIINEDVQDNTYKDSIFTIKDTLTNLTDVTYDGYFLNLSSKTSDNTNLFKELNKKDFVQISPYSNDLYLFDGVTNDLNNTLLTATIILAIFASVLIYVTMSNSINDKQKDIGILRSIGTSGKDVGYIFLIESLILTLIAVFIAIIIAYVSTYIINRSLMDYYGNNILFFDFGSRQIIYIILFSLIITLISTIVPITRLVKMKPIDVVRKK